MRRSLRALAAATAVGATIVGMAACGGDGTRLLSQAREGGPDPCPPTPGVTRNAINLGMVYSGSPYPGDSSMQFRAGVDARLGEANAAGGINGRALTYRVEDDEGTPTRGAVAGRHLAQDDHALGVLRYSSATAGSTELLAAAGVPVVDGQVSDPAALARTGSTVFSYARPMLAQPASSGWGEFFRDRGARHVAIVAVQLSSGTQAMARAADQSVRAARLGVAGDIEIPPGPLDAHAFVGQLLDTGADSLIAFVPARTFYEIAAATRDAGLGLTAVVGNPSTYERSELARAGDDARGIYTFVDYTPFEINPAAHRRFLTAMAAFAPQASALPDGTALIGWISADLLLRGITAAGACPTRAGVLYGLRHQTRYDAGGLLPAPIDLSKGLAALPPCYTYLRVSSDGAAFAPVDPTPRCGHVLPAA
jgi:ABC-type branched-subunit amino acid transport system substrate-binding protein